MAPAYVTRDDLAKTLEKIDQRLERMEQELMCIRSRTNQIYDVLEKHGLPMAKVTEA